MKTDHFLLPERDWVPNNPILPVLVYHGAVGTGGDGIADAFGSMFAENGWPVQWRDGIYSYHHYHSTAHEALGVASGKVVVMLGGPQGRSVELKAGDAIVLPVGTGHCQIERSEDLLVVGAYPEGQDWDICRDAPSKAARERMAALRIPQSDPVGGSVGLLADTWRD